MLVGIEVELHSNELSHHTICSNEELSFSEFKDIDWLWVKMSEEYYGSTIEYNFTPFNLSKNKIRDVKHYLDWQVNRYSLSYNSEWPSYVGTHVHIFDEDMLSINKPRLLECILSFILDNIDDLYLDSKHRISLGHQLWTYWSHSNDHSWYNKVSEYWLRVDYYENNSRRKKYSPIIVSPESNTGKPKSLEIRIIPNEFLFNWKLHKLLREIKTWKIYNRSRVNVCHFIEEVLNDIWHKKKRLNYSYCNRTSVAEEVTLWVDSNMILTDATDYLSDIIPTYNSEIIKLFEHNDIVDYYDSRWVRNHLKRRGEIAQMGRLYSTPINNVEVYEWIRLWDIIRSNWINNICPDFDLNTRISIIQNSFIWINMAYDSTPSWDIIELYNEMKEFLSILYNNNNNNNGI